jgi:hypothetical protein
MMKKKNMSCTWIAISIWYNKLQKNCSKIHSYEKVFFGKKNMQSLLQWSCWFIVSLLHPTKLRIYGPKCPQNVQEIFMEENMLISCI